MWFPDFWGIIIFKFIIREIFKKPHKLKRKDYTKSPYIHHTTLSTHDQYYVICTSPTHSTLAYCDASSRYEMIFVFDMKHLRMLPYHITVVEFLRSFNYENDIYMYIYIYGLLPTLLLPPLLCWFCAPTPHPSGQQPIVGKLAYWK